ncbi:MAG: HipA domain-containing protein [Lachnospiraceae bacterium]|jgi:serine/threonine-protein kinase HipA|nr:HipA domain-containing protein [Lachnospiraceae bacterium]
MNCLCCGKPLRQAEESAGWHRNCILRFFGVSEIPEIRIDDQTLELLAEETADKGYTIPGVQKKLSLHLSKSGKTSRLTLLNYPAGYILKPQVEEFRAMPEAEQLVMCMADAAGIATVPHALVQNNGTFAYITKRVDRVFEKDMPVQKLAMEDFCQLDLRLTQDKYKGSYERCAAILNRYSGRSGLDRTEFFMRVVFSFLVGNSDMHLKNFSLLETAEASGEYVLSPAYDLLPVNVLMPEDKEQLALALNGKKTHIRRKDWFIFAGHCGISEKSAEKMIAGILAKKPVFIAMCRESLLPEDLKDSLAALMEERAASLQGSGTEKQE